MTGSSDIERLNILPSPQYQQAMAKAENERDLQMARLKAASPLRKPVEQRDTDGLDLFTHDRPKLL